MLEGRTIAPVLVVGSFMGMVASVPLFALDESQMAARLCDRGLGIVQHAGNSEDVQAWLVMPVTTNAQVGQSVKAEVRAGAAVAIAQIDARRIRQRRNAEGLRTGLTHGDPQPAGTPGVVQVRALLAVQLAH